jgi:hypothetical protein
MATVWAHRVGAWTRNPATGWSHTLQMNGLGDLTRAMDRAGLKGVVTQLGIVAHGDQPGQVILNRQLTAATIDVFRFELNGLRSYLTRNGILTFYSCIAGKGEAGSRLLVALSNQLPGRTVVGFELFGLIGPPGIPNAPGNVIATETSLAQLAMDQRAQHGRLHPWCPFAKRARDGQVVHLPILEQAGRPNRTCANPQCRGHSQPSHSCSGW